MQDVVEGVAGTVAGIVGREPELEVLRGFFGAGGSRRALLLSGEAGIGKTTLWEAGVALARESGLRVLVARPSGAEARLSFSGLIDLFDGAGGNSGRGAGPAAVGARGRVVFARSRRMCRRSRR